MQQGEHGRASAASEGRCTYEGLRSAEARVCTARRHDRYYGEAGCHAVPCGESKSGELDQNTPCRGEHPPVTSISQSLELVLGLFIPLIGFLGSMGEPLEFRPRTVADGALDDSRGVASVSDGIGAVSGVWGDSLPLFHCTAPLPYGSTAYVHSFESCDYI